MANNKQTWVSPNNGNGWKVHQSNAKRASAVFETKKEAITYGRQVSRNQKTELIIKNILGQISSKDSHENDNFPPRG